MIEIVNRKNADAITSRRFSEILVEKFEIACVGVTRAIELITDHTE